MLPGTIAVAVNRIQFSIRSLMIAVLVVACALALLKQGLECLVALILLGIPLSVLNILLGKVPRRNSAGRFGISAGMLGLIILGLGWFWARVAISYFQRQAGTVALEGTSLARTYNLLGLKLPAGVTAFGLFLNFLVLVDFCTTRRRFKMLLLVMGYGFVLAIAWTALFGWLAVALLAWKL
jgi:hypothetical protein